MTHAQHYEMVVACLIGNLLHVCFKIYSLNKDYKKANIDFSVMTYLSDDKWGLIMDVAASFALVYLAEEWLGDLGNYAFSKIKSIFVFVGFTGSYVILQAMSVAKKRFRQIVDEKTNKADNIK